MFGEREREMVSNAPAAAVQSQRIVVCGFLVCGLTVGRPIVALSIAIIELLRHYYY